MDGTLCTQVFVESRGADATVEEIYKLAKPLNDRIAVVNNLYDEGNYITIDTARGSPHPTKAANEPKAEWETMTKRQLGEWGVKHHELRVGEKIHAYIYVDDRAVFADDFFKTKSNFTIRQADDDAYYADNYSGIMKLDMGEPYGPRE